jgi:hypothetical protein
LATFITGAGGVNGDAWFNGNVTLSGIGSRIGGDLEALGTITGASLTVDDNSWAGAPTLPFPNYSSATYFAAANQIINKSQTFQNYTFTSAYRVIHVTGDVHLKGSFTGTGVIYATGDVYVDTDMTYGSGASRMSVITDGNVIVAATVSNFVGYYYTRNTIQILGATTHTLTSGGLAAGTLSLVAPTTVIHDPTVWNDDTEGVRLKLPGFWP